RSRRRTEGAAASISRAALRSAHARRDAGPCSDGRRALRCRPSARRRLRPRTPRRSQRGAVTSSRTPARGADRSGLWNRRLRRAARAPPCRPSTRTASERVSRRSSARPPERRRLVVTHLLYLLHERLYRREEGLELRARAEPLDVPLGRVPQDAEHEALGSL